MKKYLALAIALCMAVSLAACGSNSTSQGSSSGSTSASQTAKGSVYYLNFKPEQDGDWQDLARMYTEQTGVPVTVVTAASGEYESTLMAEMGKTAAPTLFQVNGPVGLRNWKDYCYDLTGTTVYNELKSEDFALKDENGVYAVAYAIETYGLIYNKALLEQAGYSEADIQGFDDLKRVAEDIHARRDELGIKGAFTSAGMDGSSDWRFKTHLANVPLYYEYRDSGNPGSETIQGTYLDNYKNVWDLYVNNSTASGAELSAKTGNDAISEFVNGDAVFYQNGTWAYNDISGIGDENLGILPIYIGVEGEENQGLCTGSENYWCVNKMASEDDIQATLDFMAWCVTHEEGKTALSQDMGFVAPFNGFTEEYLPSNPLILAADAHLATGKTSVDWVFNTMPSEEWKNGVGSALTAYAAGTGAWDDVKSAFVDGWEREYKLANA